MSDHSHSDDENYDPEAEVDGNWQQVILPEVPIITGEETDEEIAKFRSKLYRWRDGQWKERGLGDLKLLQNKQNKRIRVLMRQEKTHKIVANFFILQQQGQLCTLTPQKTSDKAWIWDCCDASDEKASIEKLCAKFTSVDEFNKFKTEFEKALEINSKLSDESNKEESQEEKKE